jgi:hypothetical protein
MRAQQTERLKHTHTTSKPTIVSPALQQLHIDTHST